jgi:hypothetical protein
MSNVASKCLYVFWEAYFSLLLASLLFIESQRSGYYEAIAVNRPTRILSMVLGVVVCIASFVVVPGLAVYLYRQPL